MMILSYKNEFIEKTVEELTKEDLRKMIRGNQRKRIKVKDMMDYYKIKLEDYRDFILSKGLYLTSSERSEISEMKPKPSKEDNRTPSEIYQDMYELPDYIICSLYNIDFEYRDGKFYYDQVKLEEAREDCKGRITSYELRKLEAKEGISQNNYSDLTTDDLIAMRYYRGISREKLASKMLVTTNVVREMETTSPVTKEVAKKFMDELNIKKHHIEQLRKIINGETKEVHDDRTIPKTIKVAVWKKDKGKCSRCGFKENLHYHHIERFSEGGQNTVENLTLLCVNCHAEEHKGEKAYYMLKSITKE